MKPRENWAGRGHLTRFLEIKWIKVSSHTYDVRFNIRIGNVEKILPCCKGETEAESRFINLSLGLKMKCVDTYSKMTGLR